MGIRLIVEVLRFVPGTKLCPADRLVLVLVAERANDTTREAWQANGWNLAELAGLTDDSLRRCLARLARAGIEVRAPVGKRRDGAPLYACRGRQVTYRLPALNAGTQVPPIANKGGTQAPAIQPNAGTQVRNAGTQVPPYPSIPSERSSSPRARGPLAAFAAERGVDDEEMKLLTEKIKSTNKVRNVSAYMATLAGNGDLAGTLAEIRAERDKTTTAATVEQLRQGPPCEHGEPGGASLHPAGGEPLCVFCRHKARPPRRQDAPWET